MNCVRWGIIGGGKVVEVKSGPAFNASPKSELHAIYRRTIEKATETQKLLGAKVAYSSLEDFLADDRIDAVYIATPPGLHYEHAIACCDAGKIVYLEKPIARSFVEAEAIVKYFREKGVPLYIAHYRRALPRFIEVQKMLTDNVIGDILEFRFRLERKKSVDEQHPWLFDPQMSGGGKFVDISPHSIDILHLLFEGFEVIQSCAVNRGAVNNLEDIVVASLKTTNGILGTVNYNFDQFSRSDRLEVYGSKGKISLSIHGNTPVELILDDKVSEFEFPYPECIEAEMISEVVKSCLGLENHSCNGDQALATYETIEKIIGPFYKDRDDMPFRQ